MLTILRRVRVALSLLGIATVLTACGGGGGSESSGPTVSTISFPFATANANFINNGYTHDFSISGWQIVNGTRYDVTGSGRVVQTAAIATTFEAQAALLNTQTLTGTVTVNGQSAALPATTAPIIFHWGWSIVANSA